MNKIIHTESGKSDADIQNDVLGIFKKFPQGEEDWAYGPPQTDEEVISLFCKLTLTNQYPPEARRLMDCPEILTELARAIDTSSQLDVMTLADACEVAVRQGDLRAADIRHFMLLRLPDTSLDGIRWGTQRFIRMMDEVHLHGAAGLRTFELAIRRANALTRLASFTNRHMGMIQGECEKIYRPQRSLDSTCLRIPNIVHALFAGRYSRDAIESAHRTPAPLADRMTRQSDSFHVFITWDKNAEEDRRTASREVIGLAPTLQRHGLSDSGLPDPFPMLLDNIKAKRSLIACVAESRGWRIVDFDRWNAEVFRLEHQTVLPVPHGHLGVFVLLQDGGMISLAGYGSDREIQWNPDQVLCCVEECVHPKRQRDRPFCLSVHIAIEKN
ncbi:hypothetical protein FALBO_1379 [Fusarium albosuccineum]|uniref:Uncharacterized protein n=1 Tax=Fusarium albosuccineum TaxID=1237068 RepID=A0A8H4PM01_9HYPO|nr:hypothetical protein FALBO_1379 [Fusarium albosuccineum]